MKTSIDFLFGNFLLGIFLISCSTDKDQETGSSSDTDKITDSGGEDSGTVIESNEPRILSADAWCYSIEVGEIVETWSFKLSADDPQGAHTISTYIQGGISFQDLNGTELTTLSLICTNGECSSTTNSTAVSSSCSEASTRQVEFTVEDLDGNRSEPMTITARLGTDETG